MGCHSLLQGIFPTQGSNLCLLHWKVGSLLSEPPGKPHLLHTGVPAPFTEKMVLSPFSCLGIFLKNQLTIMCGSTSGLYIQFHQSIYLFLYQYDIISIFVFYIQSWNEVVLVLQLCSSLSKLFWVVWVFWILIHILKLVFQFLQRSLWEFDWDCVKLERSVWERELPSQQHKTLKDSIWRHCIHFIRPSLISFSNDLAFSIQILHIFC